MYVNSIDNAYYITQLKAAGHFRSLDPVKPVQKVSFNLSDSVQVDLDKDQSENSSSINQHLNKNAPVAKLFESFEPELDLFAQQKINEANKLDSEGIKQSFEEETKGEISAERKGFTLHIPEEQHKKLFENNKNVLVNEQIKLKNFYSADLNKPGVFVNLAI